MSRLENYLAGLRRELDRCPAERRSQVEAEIKNAERMLNPEAAERAERKSSRATNAPKAERAVSKPE